MPFTLPLEFNIVVLILVPDGIIKYTYPLKGNEKSIGLNI
jgi:hypothetical protein